jgi:hypothetical protein
VLINAGFIETPLTVCCGKGGRYNWSLFENCGMRGVSACDDPSAYVNWDGVHLTESANRHIAISWLNGRYIHPPILKRHAPINSVREIVFNSMHMVFGNYFK